MKSTIGAAALAAGALCLAGCATVTRGTTTQFKVSSTPDGASVKTSTGFACSPTPCAMKMPRKTAFDVTVSKDGFAPKVVHIRSEVGGGGAAGMAGNIVAGGLIGMAVDGTSGAMNDLLPNPLVVSLDRIDTPPSPPADPAPPTAPPVTPTPAPSEPGRP